MSLSPHPPTSLAPFRAISSLLQRLAPELEAADVDPILTEARPEEQALAVARLEADAACARGVLLRRGGLGRLGGGGVGGGGGGGGDTVANRPVVAEQADEIGLLDAARGREPRRRDLTLELLD